MKYTKTNRWSVCIFVIISITIIPILFQINSNIQNKVIQTESNLISNQNNHTEELYKSDNIYPHFASTTWEDEIIDFDPYSISLNIKTLNYSTGIYAYELCSEPESGSKIIIKKISYERILIWSKAYNFSTNIDEVRFFQLFVDKDDSIFVIFSIGMITSASSLYANKIDSTMGNLLWGEMGISCVNDTVYRPHDDDFLPQACTDGSGGLFVTWVDRRAGTSNLDIYAQRIGSDMTFKFIVNGTPIATKPDYQTTPKICSDLNNGAYIAWIHSESPYKEIWAQRINEIGAAYWAYNGTKITNRVNMESIRYTQISTMKNSTQNNSLLFSWVQYSGGTHALGIQLIFSNGNPGWGSNGKNITVTTSNIFLENLKVNDTKCVAVWTQQVNTKYITHLQGYDSFGNPLFALGNKKIYRPAYTEDEHLYPTIALSSNEILVTWAEETNRTYYLASYNYNGISNWIPEIRAIRDFNVSITRPTLYYINNLFYFKADNYDYNGFTFFPILSPSTINLPSSFSTSRYNISSFAWNISSSFNISGKYWIETENPLHQNNTHVTQSSWIPNFPIITQINATLPGTWKYRIYSIDYIEAPVGEYIIQIEDLYPEYRGNNSMKFEFTSDIKAYFFLIDDFGGGIYRISVDGGYLTDWETWNNASWLTFTPLPIVGEKEYFIEFSSSTAQYTNKTILISIINSTVIIPSNNLSNSTSDPTIIEDETIKELLERADQQNLIIISLMIILISALILSGMFFRQIIHKLTIIQQDLPKKIETNHTKSDDLLPKLKESSSTATQANSIEPNTPEIKAKSTKKASK